MKDPQLTVLLKYLQAGHKLTVAEALDKLRIYALSQRVGDLKKQGHAIKDEWHKTESGARVKRYYMDIQPVQTSFTFSTERSLI